MLTVIASMERELAGLRRELRKSGSASGPLAAELRVIGMGRSEGERALDSVLKRHEKSGGRARPQEGVLLLGLAGAVDPAIGTGTLVLPPRYYRQEPLHSPSSGGGGKEGRLAPDLEMWKHGVEAAAAMGAGWAGVDSLTVDHVVATPQGKQAIREEYPVSIVDMEDYWVAAACLEAGVPFLAARVVLDTAFQALPGYLPALARSHGRVAVMAAAMPWRIPALLRLARRLALAQGVLARFALAFLAQLAGAGPAPSGVPAGAAGSAPR